jgi:hypothetical protein
VVDAGFVSPATQDHAVTRIAAAVNIVGVFSLVFIVAQSLTV